MYLTLCRYKEFCQPLIELAKKPAESSGDDQRDGQRLGGAWNKFEAIMEEVKLGHLSGPFTEAENRSEVW